MFEKFTGGAKRVMAWANHEVRKGNQEYITPEHIFHGLLTEGGIGVQILTNLNVDLCTALDETKKRLRVGPERLPVGQPPPDPVAKRVIESAIAEAQTLNHNYVSTGHLLLGLILATECPPAQILALLGVTAEKIQELLPGLYPEIEN